MAIFAVVTFVVLIALVAALALVKRFRVRPVDNAIALAEHAVHENDENAEQLCKEAVRIADDRSMRDLHRRVQARRLLLGHYSIVDSTAASDLLDEIVPLCDPDPMLQAEYLESRAWFVAVLDGRNSDVEADLERARTIRIEANRDSPIPALPTVSIESRIACDLGDVRLAGKLLRSELSNLPDDVLTDRAKRALASESTPLYAAYGDLVALSAMLEETEWLSWARTKMELLYGSSSTHEQVWMKLSQGDRYAQQGLTGFALAEARSVLNDFEQSSEIVVDELRLNIAELERDLGDFPIALARSEQCLHVSNTSLRERAERLRAQISYLSHESDADKVEWLGDSFDTCRIQWFDHCGKLEQADALDRARLEAAKHPASFRVALAQSAARSWDLGDRPSFERHARTLRELPRVVFDPMRAQVEMLEQILSSPDDVFEQLNRIGGGGSFTNIMQREAMLMYASLLWGRYGQAHAHAVEIEKRTRTVGHSGSPTFAYALLTRASSAIQAKIDDDVEGAIETARHLIEQKASCRGLREALDHALAFRALRRGRLDSAEEHARNGLKRTTRRFRNAGYPTTRHLHVLSQALAAQGRHEEAVKTLTSAVERSTAFFGPTHPATLRWARPLEDLRKQNAR